MSQRRKYKTNLNGVGLHKYKKKWCGFTREHAAAGRVLGCGRAVFDGKEENGTRRGMQDLFRDLCKERQGRSPVRLPTS